MSDVLFRFLLMARRRDRSFVRRFLFSDEQLLEAGVEQLVETAAARIRVTSQHERVGVRTTTVPASYRHRVRFYDVARPDRPTAGKFEERSQDFPLAPTLKVYSCVTCRGRGEVRCRSCRGRGRVRCAPCRGSGWLDDRHRCGSCGGSGRASCSPCGGRGQVTCGRCRGEGQLATWKVETYLWRVERRSGEEYPLAKHPIGRAFDRWLKVNPDRVADLEPVTAAEHLGYETPQALAVVQRADALRRDLERKARESPDPCLFHRSDCSLAPVGYTVVRLAGRARYYWLVGRGEKAREVGPLGRPDGWKLGGWLGLGSGGTLSLEAVDRAFEAAGADLLTHLDLLNAVPDLWLAGGTAAGWLLALAAVRRVLARKPPVLTVGLLPVSGQPTPWLTCLAYLGSYTQRLRVLDRAYDTQLARLLGKMRPARQSESLSAELADGRKVRLVEVARPGRLSDGQLRLMLEALDGVMMIEEKDQPEPAQELAQRLRSLDSEAKIGTVAVDRAAAGDLAAASAVPLEAIRRAFVDGDDDVDWDDLFLRIWQPVDDLLAAGRRTRGQSS